MQDITKFPHAEGIGITRRDDLSNQKSHTDAFLNAVYAFINKYNRNPHWEIIRFRGCHSTHSVVLEIWEKE